MDEKKELVVSEKLKQLNIDWTVEGFEEFVRQSIQDREYAKFLFSKNISAALEELVQFGKMHGVTRDQISHVDLKDIFSIRNNEIAGGEDWLLNKWQDRNYGTDG